MIHMQRRITAFIFLQISLFFFFLRITFPYSKKSRSDVIYDTAAWNLHHMYIYTELKTSRSYPALKEQIYRTPPRVGSQGGSLAGSHTPAFSILEHSWNPDSLDGKKQKAEEWWRHILLHILHYGHKNTCFWLAHRCSVFVRCSNTVLKMSQYVTLTTIYEINDGLLNWSGNGYEIKSNDSTVKANSFWLDGEKNPQLISDWLNRCCSNLRLVLDQGFQYHRAVL